MPSTEPRDRLMSRVGIAAQRLARDLGTLAAGDRLPRVQDAAAALGCGNGTVQAALELLQDAGAITLRPRGRLGTFLDAVDHRVLWELAGNRTVSVAMPLPYSRRYEGLATGLQEAFVESGVPLSLMFMRGAETRAVAVAEGRADLAVMSGLVAGDRPDLVVVRDFGAGSYVSSHGLVVARGRDPHDPGLRVAVDQSSADQVELTRRHFGDLDPARVVEASYNQLDRYFATGRIDATIWNLDEIEVHITSPIDTYPVADVVGGANTRAVIVAPAAAPPTSWVVLDALAAESVATSAAAVLSGERIPSY
ncbi:MAG: GntR family transcriptional regulator YhfZ [Nocardioidaceae bacterium]|nr:GntR family transcriptional regulator YhfZ [Nocardioidaceae bacterium]